MPGLVLALMPLLAVVPASAAPDTCTWTGTSSNDTADAANWTGCDNGDQPEAGDQLVFPAGASSFTPAWNTNLDFETITISGDGYNIFAGTGLLSTDFLSLTGSNNSIFTNMEFISNGGSNGWTATGTGNVISGNIALNTGGAAVSGLTNGDLTLSGIISGLGGGTFQSQGNAELTLSAANTFSGLVIVSSGTLTCSSVNCFGDDTNTVRDLNAASTGTLQFDTDLTLVNDITLFSEVGHNTIVITDGTDIAHTGGLNLNSSADINVTVGSGTASYINTGTVVLSGASQQLDFVGSAGNSSIVRFNGTTNTAVGSEVSVENAILYLGSGTTTAINGVLRASTDATISASGNDALGSASGNTILEDGGRLLVGTATTGLTEDITVSGEGLIRRSASVGNDVGVAGNITLAGNLKFDPGSTAGDMTITGAISGTGNIVTGETIGAGGTLRLASPSGNSYVGTFTVEGGALAETVVANQNHVTGDLTVESGQFTISSANTVSDNSNVTVDSGATFSVFDEDTIASLTGAGTLELGDTLTIAGSSDTAFTGDITGADDIVYSGSGTFSLNPSNGSTNPGTVALNVTGGTVTSNSDVTKLVTSINGGTLAGTGTFGTTTLTTGAFAPGNSPGCNTVSGALNLNGGSFVAELDSTTACSGYDQTTVTGAVNIAGASLDVDLGFTPAAGDVFTVILSDNLTGTFTGLADGSTLSVDGTDFRVNYTDDDVLLTVLAVTTVTPDTTDDSGDDGALATTGTAAATSALAGLGMLLLSGSTLVLSKNR